MKTIIKPFILISLYAVAMAVVESAVVVYLREIYYPSGFSTAFNPAAPKLFPVELTRELATLVMLVTVSWVAGKNKISRFAWFLYSFAIWDIFYYVFLKIFISWPVDPMVWDVLFLFPVPWLAPVLAPIISSSTMILVAFVLLFCDQRKENFKISFIPLSLFIIGFLAILTSYIIEYSLIIIKNGFYTNFFLLHHNQSFINIASNFTPKSFNWVLFGIGELVILFGIYKIRLKKPIRIDYQQHYSKVSLQESDPALVSLSDENTVFQSGRD